MAAVYNPTVRIDLWIRAGDSYSTVFTVKENGAIVDLTGFTVRSQVRAEKTSATVMITPTVTITSASAGQITFSLTPAQTEAVTGDTQWYDVETTSPTGFVKTRVEGVLRRERDVTR